LTWWHRLPPTSTRGQRRRKGEASHGPYWHRRAQEGKPDLHPRRGREIIERRIRTEGERFAAALGPRLEALGHEAVVADPNFAPM
jgi:hypothetical protein